MRLLNTRLGRNDRKFNAEAWIEEAVNDDNGFFRCLYWVVLLLAMILLLAITTDLKAEEMSMYLKAMRINNG